jgi:hypothetical protein
MKSVANELKKRIVRFATILATVLVGIGFVLATTPAAASEVNKAAVAKVVVNKAVLPVKVVLPVEKALVVKAAVLPEAKSDVAVRRVNPFGFRPFGFRPFFNPFVDEEFFGFGAFD